MAIKFYKKEYLIAVYDAHDNLVGVHDNVHEFAAAYDKKYDVAQHIVGRLSNGKRKAFYHGTRQLTIFLIPLDPEEIQELQKEEGKPYARNTRKRSSS